MDWEVMVGGWGIRDPRGTSDKEGGQAGGGAEGLSMYPRAQSFILAWAAPGCREPWRQIPAVGALSMPVGERGRETSGQDKGTGISQGMGLEWAGV